MDKKTEPLYCLRHSASHVLAEAVTALYPGTKLAIGPAIQNGFYYDFDSPQIFREEELQLIEEKMQEIIKEGQGFSMEHWSGKEAKEYFEKRGELYKLEILQGLSDEKIGIVKNGDFIDLCEGGHVKNTNEIKAFKLLSVAGAYWRGDERNAMLQRIYGTAFFSKKELDYFLKQQEEAKKRDHRKLGKQLDLFSFNPEAPGMPFYHAKGTVLYGELVKYWREEHVREGYEEIKTPLLLKDELWKQSGHYEHYQENMFFSEKDGVQFAVKPMNCPGHTLIYRASQRSYRDLPIRFAELGMVHRRELSGVLHGLFRVNAFTIDDAHIFCMEPQIESEITKCIALIRRIYKTFGFEKIQIFLSTRPKDSMGSEELWDKATDALKKALEKNKVSFDIHEGGGAFYGPKIDFEITDSIGRNWQCGTVQLDFQMPERFGLEYIDSASKPKCPVLVHRAVFGSVERFYGILVEHYAGAFPVWLAPVQVTVATISDKHIDCAEKILARLMVEGIRGEGDLRAEKIGKKIREAELQKVPYVFIIGDNEMKTGNVSVRMRGRKDLGQKTLDEIISTIKNQIQQRAE